MIKTIARIEDAVLRVEGVLLFCAMFLLIVMLSLQVVFRFVLQLPLAFTEEAGRILFAWLIFVGAARALHVSQHFMVDILYNAVPNTLRNLFGTVTDIITIIFALILAWAGFHMAFAGTQILPVLGLPIWVQSSALMVGMTLLAFHAICFPLRRQHIGDGAGHDFEEE